MSKSEIELRQAALWLLQRQAEAGFTTEAKAAIRLLEAIKERHAAGGVCPWCLMAQAIKHNTRVMRVAYSPDDLGDWVQYPIENFKKDRTAWHNEHGYRIPANEL